MQPIMTYLPFNQDGMMPMLQTYGNGYEIQLEVENQKSKNMLSILNYDYILYSSTPLFEQNFFLTANIKFYAWILTPLMFSPCNFKRFKVVTAKL
jgi:hypothetical protein